MNAEDLTVPTWLKRHALVEYFHRVDQHDLMRAVEALSDEDVDRVHAEMTSVLLWIDMDEPAI